MNEEGNIASELLSEEDRFLYRHIVEACEMQDLQRWVGFMVRKKFEKSIGSDKSGILSSWLSWGFRQNDLSADEA